MSLNSEVLETFDALPHLIPSEDSLLFKEPDPGPISQDVFSSLDLPDFSNFAVEDVDFGDLEFLDLATAPLDKTKKSNSSSCTGPYFNSLATPSGYCSTNFLTEEANRLSVLLSDCGSYKEKGNAGDSLEKNLLDNLEEFFGVGQNNSEGDKTFTNNVSGDLDTNSVINPSEVVYEVPPNVLTLLNPPQTTQTPTTSDSEPNININYAEDYRQMTIKSVVSLPSSSPPPGAIAKIIIRTSKKNNYTKFTFASIDDKEKHSFVLKTANLKKAINSLKPLNLDSVEVIRRILQMGPIVPYKPPPKRLPEFDIVSEINPKRANSIEISCDSTSISDNLKPIKDDEATLKQSLLKFGIKIDHITRVKIASGQMFWCCPEENCQKAYGKGHELKLHILGHYKVKPYQCDVPGCSWGFVTQNKLNRHKQSHTKSKLFECNIEGCKKSFTTVYNLNTHLKLHNRAFAFECSVCVSKFQTQRELELHHIQQHKQEMLPNLKCPVDGCSKVYFTKSTLDFHLKTHSTSNASTCGICGKVFDRPSRLKTHMVFHTGDRPFACDFEGCSWTFPTQSKLARHKRTHTNEKKFGCPKCDKYFGRSDHLQLHLNTHKDIKSKENLFDTDGSPMKHLQCPIIRCSKKYVTKAAFKAHLKTVHNRDTEEMLDSLSTPGDDISAGQLDFVALLSCVDDLQLPVPVQVVESEEVVSMDSELLTAVNNTPHCQDILFTDTVAPSTINLQDLQ